MQYSSARRNTSRGVLLSAAALVAGCQHVQETTPPLTPAAGSSRPLSNEKQEGSMAEAIIRQRVQDYVNAIRAKDLDGVMRFFASDLVSFDLAPPLRYSRAENKRREWQKAFTAFHSIGYEIRDLNVTTEGELALVRGLNHFTGTPATGPITDVWVRWTACFRKIDGVWVIVHDHVSVPADLQQGRAALDLTP
jgi:ketosteroid isomerase-like protein